MKVFLRFSCRVVAVKPQDFCAAVLDSAFGDRISIRQCAISDRVGTPKFYVCDTEVLSSMSKEAIRRTVESSRFAGHRWEAPRMVEPSTLDALCEVFGQPPFVKIDVEGHKASVLGGLSIPVPLLSFEFAPEIMQAAFNCLARLQHIAPYRFNYSPFETMEFDLGESASLADVKVHLSLVSKDGWSDVYTRLQ